LEVSALKHAGAAGMHGSSPLLRLQSDERLIALVRRGNHSAFEALVKRYQARLLAFCRHMLGSKEDAEDVLQEVFAAAFNAILADERAINVRPWLYRIARNRSLNHLRRVQAIGVDSMDIHFSEAGLTTAEKVHKREDFRLLLSDVGQLPETQRTALLLREIDALSYDQIAEAMETTIPSVKSLLVRARVSLAEAAEARQLSCEEVRLELGEVAEGLKRISPPVRRHVKGCERCGTFRQQLKETNKALAAVFPIGPLLLFKKFVLAHLGTTTAAGGGAAAGGTAAGAGAGGLVGAGASTIATKAAATVAAAAIVTAGAVEVRHAAVNVPQRRVVAVAPPAPAQPRKATITASAPVARPVIEADPALAAKPDPKADAKADPKATAAAEKPATDTGGDVAQVSPPAATTPAATTPAATAPAPPKPAPAPPQPQTDESTAVLPSDDTTTTPAPVTDTVQAPPSASAPAPAAPPAGEGSPAPVATTPTTTAPAASSPAPVAPPAGETP
jgi:RNA polymerase sigma factor (sigma-70 family)